MVVERPWKFLCLTHRPIEQLRLSDGSSEVIAFTSQPVIDKTMDMET